MTCQQCFKTLFSRYQNEDIVFIRFDPFKDARANYIIGANAYGSQLDIRVKNATTEEDTFDPNYNTIYETKGNIVSDGYILEFKIPLNFDLTLFISLIKAK